MTEPNPYASAPEPTPYSNTSNGQSGKTNTLAIVSLVTSLAGLITYISAIAGIITGHMALSQIKKTGEQGRGMALAGTIIGYVITIGGLLLIILFFVGIVALFGNEQFMTEYNNQLDSY